ISIISPNSSSFWTLHLSQSSASLYLSKKGTLSLSKHLGLINSVVVGLLCLSQGCSFD
ncbi:hypothetical protein GIB67_006480, partial [Kingdonia uniflora]